MSVKTTGRIRLLKAVAVVVAAILLGRLFLVQVIAGGDYRARANRQYTRPAGAVFDRGSIFFQDRNGQLVSAAGVESGFLLAINPVLVIDNQVTYAKLATVLPALDGESFMTKAGKDDDPYEEIATRLSEAEAKAINDLELAGVSVHPERWRFYPAGSLAAHTIGFLGYRDDEFAGRYGLEKQYDELLTPSGESSSLARIWSEVLGSSLAGKKEETKASIVTTIEPNVERFLEDELAAFQERWSPDQLGGIVMDPQTGRILAFGSSPNFDPGEKIEDISLLPNPLVEKVFEMGSIVKPITMAAALDAGAVTAETTYVDRGKLTIANRTIGNYDGSAHGTVSMQTVLSKSLNTGAVFAQQKLGEQKFINYFSAFGFGEKTGIDLPNETAGLIANLEKGGEIAAATASYGQGVSLSPIAMTRALSVLAAGGVLPAPHVVEQLVYQDGSKGELAREAPKSRQVIKKETAAEITSMLVKVVDEALVGGRAKLPHYQVAAKTGTAQIPKAGGGYEEGKFLHSFFGYFPAYEAKFIVFLYAVNPRGAQYSSETLTDPFIHLTKFLLNYYQVPPDR